MSFSDDDGVIALENEDFALDALTSNFQNLGTVDTQINSPVLQLEFSEIADDFYQNPLDWSAQNVVAIVDGNEVVMVNPDDISTKTNIATTSQMTSLKFSNDGSLIALGSSNGSVQVFDVASGDLFYESTVHSLRVGCMSWQDNMLFTGSLDKTIYAHEMNEKTNCLIGSHSAEICCLKYSSPDGKLISGGNDDTVKVWDIDNFPKLVPFAEYKIHKSAVKAIDFPPNLYGVVATGGGCRDGRILIWVIATGENQMTITVDKQITNIAWVRDNEIITTYGSRKCSVFDTVDMNHIDMWSLETSKITQRFEGHKGRVLFMAMSPDKSSFVTAGADNTLKFWKI